MVLSKGKRQLAELLIAAGVTKFPDGANWAAQGSSDLKASFYCGKKRPECARNDTVFCGDYCGNTHDVQLSELVVNWRQTVLSRDEFDQVVEEAGGWIEWAGDGKCPVDEGVIIDVKFRDGTVQMACAARCDKQLDHRYWTWIWSHSDHGADIIAYRLHKPEQSLGSPISREKFANGSIDTGHIAAAPTFDQLLQDWRNAADYAARKQAEADEAAALRDQRWQAVQERATEFGVAVRND